MWTIAQGRRSPVQNLSTPQVGKARPRLRMMQRLLEATLFVTWITDLDNLKEVHQEKPMDTVERDRA
jgi:hypothetical protein